LLDATHVFHTVINMPHPCDTISHRQHASQVDDGWLVRLLPLLDCGDELLADVLDQVLAAELGAAHLIKGLRLSSKTLRDVRSQGCKVTGM
jgi:hypothetical protein